MYRYTEDERMMLEDKHISFSKMQGKRVLITGATGLIGQNLVRVLCHCTAQIQIVILVRDCLKAEDIFGDLLQQYGIEMIEGDILELPEVHGNIHYIIHAACQTSSETFVKSPVEVIHTAFLGTDNLLQLARAKNAEKFVFLSTMEVYGTPKKNSKITEESPASLNTMEVRNCYPESKRMCENLCVAYASEYGVPVNVVRLTQTIGPGVSRTDKRVFVYFARCAVEGHDIVLHTKGKTERNYLYITDAIRAILTIMLKAPSGEAYNVANEETYCSIYEMATLVANKIADGKIGVRIEEDDINKYGYAPALYMDLDTTKLRNLGWKANVSLEEAYRRLIAFFGGSESWFL